MYYITLKSIKYNSCVYVFRDDQLGLDNQSLKKTAFPSLSIHLLTVTLPLCVEPYDVSPSMLEGHLVLSFCRSCLESHAKVQTRIYVHFSIS